MLWNSHDDRNFNITGFCKSFPQFDGSSLHVKWAGVLAIKATNVFLFPVWRYTTITVLPMRFQK